MLSLICQQTREWSPTSMHNSIRGVMCDNLLSSMLAYANIVLATRCEHKFKDPFCCGIAQPTNLLKINTVIKDPCLCHKGFMTVLHLYICQTFLTKYLLQNLHISFCQTFQRHHPSHLQQRWPLNQSVWRGMPLPKMVVLRSCLTSLKSWRRTPRPGNRSRRPKKRRPPTK